MMVPGESDKKKKAGMIRFVPAFYMRGIEYRCNTLLTVYHIFTEYQVPKNVYFSVCEWISCTE